VLRGGETTSDTHTFTKGYTTVFFEFEWLLISMDKKGITLLGLGPGDPKLLTREAWLILNNASEVYLRTSEHPTVSDLSNTLQVHSFDFLYEDLDSFQEVYDRIVETVLSLGRSPEGVIYCVPGDPFIGESTSPEIYHRAQDAGIPVQVCHGISFIEPVFAALGIDPLPFTSLVDALTLMDWDHPRFPPDTPTLIAQIYDAYTAGEVKLNLMSVFPDLHEVKLVHSAGTEREIVEDLFLYEIDRSPHVGLSTVLYLPALDDFVSFEGLQEIAARLRSPEGCPWDREQTLKTMRPHLLEETYEALAAIDKHSPLKIQEELGDLLLVILMVIQISSEEGLFTSADVVKGISTKLIRRHPHVFGTLEVAGTKEVLRNWEILKTLEREENGDPDKFLLDGVSITLPALVQAQEYQDRAARIGFDWRGIEGVFEKIVEEIQELSAATSESQRTSEIGDLLFSIVNISRWLEIDAESALREANNRFRERFSYIERICRDRGLALSQMSLEELDKLWDEAKKM
jgi:tetrapyrrole methylase family protein/MazG family protein